MQYHIGQYIMYRNSGICRVENIGKLGFSKSNQEYYTLRPPFTTSNECIYVPVHTDVSMRVAMTSQEAYTYLSKLKQMNPDITVHLTLFNATIAEGIPQKLEHNDIQWITPDQVANFDFCPADEEILKEIKKRYKMPQIL